MNEVRQIKEESVKETEKLPVSRTPKEEPKRG